MGILQKRRDGTERPLSLRAEDTVDTIEDEEAEKPNLRCECGCTEFRICWWDYDYCGCFCKITCTKCDEETVLFNDFA